MKRLFVFIIFIILLAISACKQEIAKPTPSSPKKKAEFKREVFNSEKYPGLNAVGKIKILETKWCSITLVAEDIGITAGHCFLSSSTKFNLTRFTEVVFKTENEKPIDGINVQRVIKRKINPDFAVVKFNKKIPQNLVKPIKISELKYADMLENTEKLGCAAFNGDKELGKKGKVLTISKNIKIYYETSNSERIDTNCVSTYGGSGGLFFEEKYNPKTEANEYYFAGVIWGVTGDNYNKKGERINKRDVITSITPVKVFRNELAEIIDKN